MMQQGTQYAWIGVVPRIFFLVLFLIVALRYIVRNRTSWHRFIRIATYQRLVWMAILFRIGFAGLLTALQYITWESDGLGKIFLHEALSKSLPIPLIRLFPWIFGSSSGYFVFYSLQRFWLNIALSILIGWLFYKFLILLKRHKERFFEDGETELGYVIALVVGWPAFTIFVPMCFLSVVLVSLFRLIFFKEAYTTLGWSFLLAALTTLLFGGMFLSALGLSVLSI